VREAATRAKAAGATRFCMGAAYRSPKAKELAVVAQMDWMMLLTTFVMAVAAAMLAGLLPTWRACQVTPALQLKSQ